MLKNYKLDKNDVVYQVKKNKFIYDAEYTNNSYNSLGHKVDMMSHLRLGYLLGSLPEKLESILDVGYGNGNFINLAANFFNKTYGFDIEPSYKLNKPSIKLTSIYEKTFDVVCFFDSLEHFEDIYEIKKLKTKYIIISVPCCFYPENDLWFSQWKHRKPDEHLWHFNQQSLISFMQDIGYKLVTSSFIEDVIRKSDQKEGNILTAIFKKK